MHRPVVNTSARRGSPVSDCFASVLRKGTTPSPAMACRTFSLQTVECEASEVYARNEKKLLFLVDSSPGGVEEM